MKSSIGNTVSTAICAAPFSSFLKSQKPAGLRKIIPPPPFSLPQLQCRQPAQLISDKTKIKSNRALSKRTHCSHKYGLGTVSDRYFQIFLSSLKFNGKGLPNQSHRFALLGRAGGEVPSIRRTTILHCMHWSECFNVDCFRVQLSF